LRVAVPDGFCPDEKYLDYVRPGGTGAGSDDHKYLYNHLTFAELFLKAGFRIKLLEYYDSKGKFHFVDWNPEDGKIRRSRRFDKRNKDGVLKYTSVILDAYKIS
jgi:predicted SAM-dependent methyltransferase